MPTIIASLFLPYTVDFKDLPEEPQPRQQALPFSAKLTGRAADKPAKSSLFSPSAKDTANPHATEEASGPDGPLTTNLTESVRKHFPHALVRSDSFLPEWTNDASVFRQPKGASSNLPPDTILKYNRPEKPEQPRPVAVTPPSPSRASASQRSARLSRSGRRSSCATQGDDWTIEPAFQGNGGLTSAIKAGLDGGDFPDGVVMVGTLGFPTDSLKLETRARINQTLEDSYNCQPAYVSDVDFDGHYRHYCKTILWPVFHYQIPDHPKSKAYQDHSWEYYVNLNQAFADKIVSTYKKGDAIWIHDYHLLLVPGMIREKLPDAQIGFFLHVAFPSSEVFRCLSVRNELLTGMLGANLIVFQNQEYLSHFLTTCSRLLLVEAVDEGVQLENRIVNVSHCPIGIDPAGLADQCAQIEVKRWIKEIANRYQGKKLIVSRDKLDLIRGVRQKLLAFEQLLEQYPEYRENVVLVQVAISSPDENSELQDMISTIVTRIEGRFSTLSHQPLVFLRQDIDFLQYLALLSEADVLMLTSLRDGMNLSPHEFTVCQDGKYGSKKHGPIILSEFMGSASVFGNAPLIVNPWDYNQCARTMAQALSMPVEEKETRHMRMRDTVYNNTGRRWHSNLQQSLSEVCQAHQEQDSSSIPRLDVGLLQTLYNSEEEDQNKKRLFFLDYEGALVPRGNSNLVKPQRAIDAVNYLLQDPKNIVYVMSDSKPEYLERVFARTPGVGIIAENGYFLREFKPSKQLGSLKEAGVRANDGKSTTSLAESIRKLNVSSEEPSKYPSQTKPATIPEILLSMPNHKDDGEWTTFADLGMMNHWKREVLKTLSYYSERIEGSRIEERNCSIVFHYGGLSDNKLPSPLTKDSNDAETNQFSTRSVEDSEIQLRLQVSEVVSHINDIFSNHSPRIHAIADPEGKQFIVQVDGRVWDKSKAAAVIVERLVKSGSAIASPDPTGPSDTTVLGNAAAAAASALGLSAAVGADRPISLLFVAGDNRDNERLFRWANGLGEEDCASSEATETTIPSLSAAASRSSLVGSAAEERSGWQSHRRSSSKLSSASSGSASVQKADAVVSVSTGTRNTKALYTLPQRTAGLLSVLRNLGK